MDAPIHGAVVSERICPGWLLSQKVRVKRGPGKPFAGEACTHRGEVVPTVMVLMKRYRWPVDPTRWSVHSALV